METKSNKFAPGNKQEEQFNIAGKGVKLDGKSSQKGVKKLKKFKSKTNETRANFLDETMKNNNSCSQNSNNKNNKSSLPVKETTNPTTTTNNVNKQDTLNTCAACHLAIKERYLLVALDKQWHEDCLKCACCDCRLGEVGSSLFTHSGKILCRRDFLRIFGHAGRCAGCQKPIPPYEMVMRANENAYHMDCFACQLCQYRFCVGDRFHLWPSASSQKRIVCTVCQAEQTSQGVNLGDQARSQEEQKLQDMDISLDKSNQEQVMLEGNRKLSNGGRGSSKRNQQQQQQESCAM